MYLKDVVMRSCFTIISLNDMTSETVHGSKRKQFEFEFVKILRMPYRPLHCRPEWCVNGALFSRTATDRKLCQSTMTTTVSSK